MSRRDEKEEGLDDASQSARQLMEWAGNNIDAIFGEGYAHQHPELIGAYMQVTMRECVILADRLSVIGTHLMKYLGTGDAATTMGAIECLAVKVEEVADAVSQQSMVYGEGPGDE